MRLAVPRRRVGAVLERSSGGWRGIDTSVAGLRRLRDVCQQLLVGTGAARDQLTVAFQRRAASGRKGNLTRRAAAVQNNGVSQQEIDDYLANLDEPMRTTLRELRDTIHSIVPESEPGISYGMPAFRLHGKVIAGFAAFKNHLSYLPHSGSVFAELQDDVAGYVTSKGALQFPIDKPLPQELVEKLIAVRLREVRQP